MTIKEIMANARRVNDRGEQRNILIDRAHRTEHRMYDASENVVRDDMRTYATELHVMSDEATPREILIAAGVRRKNMDMFRWNLEEIAAFLESKETSREFVLESYGEDDFVFRVTKDY